METKITWTATTKSGSTDSDYRYRDGSPEELAVKEMASLAASGINRIKYTEEAGKFTVAFTADGVKFTKTFEEEK